MAGHIVQRQMTPEEAQLQISASAVQLAQALVALQANPKLLQQLGNDAAAALQMTNDLSAKWQQAQADISAANMTLASINAAQAQLSADKDAFAKDMVQKQSDFNAQTAEKSSALSAQANQLSAAAISLATDKKSVDGRAIQLTLDRQAMSTAYDALNDQLKKKYDKDTTALDARKISLDKREVDLAAREQAVAALKSVLG